MILNVSHHLPLPRKNFKTNRANIIVIPIGLLLIWIYRQPVANFLQVVSDRGAIIDILEQFGPLGVILLAGVLILQVIIAAIPGHALMIGGSYVFGFGNAFWINLLSTVVGSQLAFLLARSAGRPLIERLAPADLLHKWNRISASKGLFFFMVSFMLPVFPADVMNYVAGFSSLSSRRFLIANLFGRLPGVALMTAVGAYGFEFSIQQWMIILVLGMAMFIAFRRLAVGRLSVGDHLLKSGFPVSQANKPDSPSYRGAL